MLIQRVRRRDQLTTVETCRRTRRIASVAQQQFEDLRTSVPEVMSAMLTFARPC